MAKLAIKKVIISYKSMETLREQQQDRQVEVGEGSPAGFESHTHPQQLSEELRTAHNALLLQAHLKDDRKGRGQAKQEDGSNSSPC